MGGGAAAAVSVADPRSLLGASEGDIIAELVELVVTALDKGETQMRTELHDEEATSRLENGTAITVNMPCTLASGKGGVWRVNAEVQVVGIDKSGNFVIIQLRHDPQQTMQLQCNPQPFTFRDLRASFNPFENLLGHGGGSRVSDHTDLEYSRTDPTAGDGCLNQYEMVNMFKVLVNEACDHAFRTQLLREFATKPQYATIPAPVGTNIQHQNIYLARCLTQQLLVEDMNEFLHSHPVRRQTFTRRLYLHFCLFFSRCCFILLSFTRQPCTSSHLRSSAGKQRADGPRFTSACTWLRAAMDCAQANYRHQTQRHRCNARRHPVSSPFNLPQSNLSHTYQIRPSPLEP